jgi:hypothetical protein
MRNALCHRYDLCLNLAAHLGCDFCCDYCQYRESYSRSDADLFGYWLLIAAIFKPAIYRQFVRVDSRWKN